MEDVTDPVFRSLCRQLGADLTFTEFVSSDALIRDIQRTKDKLNIFNEERPTGIQIYGKDIDAMTLAAIIAEDAKPEVIDLNFGCPVKKIATKGAGAGLLKDIPLMIRIAEAVVKSVKTPVTAKTRLGWDENSINIQDTAEKLQDVGIQALTIHGRTRAQLYSGTADWKIIGEVKNNPRIKIPIIGNGDINNPQQARNYFDTYGIDAIMIGRAAIGSPWIFREIRHFLDTGIPLKPITLEEHVEIVRLRLRKTIDLLGERRGILHSRRHLAITFKGIENFKPLRIRMLQSESPQEIEAILDIIKLMVID
jgi:nifR3 family TIM-barrel protein